MECEVEAEVNKVKAKRDAWRYAALLAVAAACIGACAANPPPVQENVYEVIVAGGGPAGIGAGYMAATRGAKTLVLEKSGRLGGMAVSAMVSPFSLCTDSPVVRALAKKIGYRVVYES